MTPKSKYFAQCPFLPVSLTWNQPRFDGITVDSNICFVLAAVIVSDLVNGSIVPQSYQQQLR